MTEILHSKIFFVTLTCGVYFLARTLYRKVPFFLFNPVLLSIAGIIAILLSLDISYPEYNEGGSIISFFLGTAVVALAVPLYTQMKEIKKQSKMIFTAVFSACGVAVISVLFIAAVMGATEQVLISLAPKAVTTPIAMSISEKIGGLASLTAVFVMIAGLTGSIFGLPFLKLIRVKSPKAMGMAMGAASHGLGTATVSELGKEYGAYGGLALGLCGVVTALITPFIVELLVPVLQAIL
ncbi:membrane protein [Fulvitalea axinellae]|uniref:Membrane protein n=1 Tax=Fulvitalea axinellae TaxID=1182444 RepID=A0AAU9CMI8_9BACT|nr:membrane protein [Fulvitalea axinellae]